MAGRHADTGESRLRRHRDLILAGATRASGKVLDMGSAD